MWDYRAVTNHPSELVGKTIVRAETQGEFEGDFGAFRLYFSDGSSVEVIPQGYEADQ